MVPLLMTFTLEVSKLTTAANCMHQNNNLGIDVQPDSLFRPMPETPMMVTVPKVLNKQSHVVPKNCH